MPSEINNELARLSLAGPFSLLFVQDPDRTAHRFVLQTIGTQSLLLQSVELGGDAAGSPLASPVFQAVHEENLPQGPALMAVGQWGKIHFSGVFQQVGSGVSKCDIAARVRQSDPVQLASTYTLVATTSDLVSADESHIVCRVPGMNLSLRIDAGKGSRLALAEAGRAALRVQILPELENQANLPAARTIQWNYTLALVNA